MGSLRFFDRPSASPLFCLLEKESEKVNQAGRKKVTARLAFFFPPSDWNGLEPLIERGCWIEVEQQQSRRSRGGNWDKSKEYFQ